TAAGAIPAGIILTVPTVVAGAYQVRADIPNGGTVEASASFTVSTTTSGGGGTPVPTPTPTPTPTTVVMPTLVQIGAAGLSEYLDTQAMAMGPIQVTSDNGITILAVPIRTRMLDASSNPLTFVEIKVQQSPPAPTAGYSLIGTAYDCLPNGAQFQPAITLSIAYSPTNVPTGVSKQDMVIAYYDGSKWEPLQTTPDPAANLLSASVSHFTQFTILAKPPATPAPSPSPTPKPSPSPLPKPTPTTPTPTATATPSPSPSPTTIIVPPTTKPPAKSSEPPWLLIGGGVGGLILVVLIVYLYLARRRSYY
ncbi:MAG: hypothetical protein Q8O16_03340, partial [Dehalococcoidia bacterium]|nr:hypothetical protein [Dehalococcoidia bacterium]